MRNATAEDRKYRSALQALQAEQAGLNRRIKAQRERANQITAEFYALKSEWAAKTGAQIIIWE